MAKELAQEIGYVYIDTGAMYRAVALKAIRLGINPNDAERVRLMLKDTHISVENDGGVQRTLLDGEDVSGLIRTQQVSKGASDIGVILEVRQMLVREQQRIAQNTDLVMEGRDIGSWSELTMAVRIIPRFYLRLKLLKRFAFILAVCPELLKPSCGALIVAPLPRVSDAILVDTTDMTIEQAVKTVTDRVKAVYYNEAGGKD